MSFWEAPFSHKRQHSAASLPPKCIPRKIVTHDDKMFDACDAISKISLLSMWALVNLSIDWRHLFISLHWWEWPKKIMVQSKQ